MPTAIPTLHDIEERIQALTMSIRCCTHLDSEAATLERDELLELWATLTKKPT